MGHYRRHPDQLADVLAAHAETIRAALAAPDNPTTAARLHLTAANLANLARDLRP